MSATANQAVHNLGDYSEFLRVLGSQGAQFVVIGGLAVGAYANLIDTTVKSADCDLYTSASELQVILSHMRRLGVRIRKEPVPREVPVAFFEWDGMEVNVLSSSRGLPGIDAAQAAAREFHLKSAPGVSVLVADPFHLLANKLAVDRPKDRPHIPVLLQFIEEEIVAAMKTETQPRKRILPAKRLMDVTNTRFLEEKLFMRLLSLARVPADFRFLAGVSPTQQLAQPLLTRSPDTETRTDVGLILEERFARRPRKRR